MHTKAHKYRNTQKLTMLTEDERLMKVRHDANNDLAAMCGFIFYPKDPRLYKFGFVFYFNEF